MNKVVHLAEWLPAKLQGGNLVIRGLVTSRNDFTLVLLAGYPLRRPGRLTVYGMTQMTLVVKGWEDPDFKREILELRQLVLEDLLETWQDGWLERRLVQVQRATGERIPDDNEELLQQLAVIEGVLLQQSLAQTRELRERTAYLRHVRTLISKYRNSNNQQAAERAQRF